MNYDARILFEQYLTNEAIKRAAAKKAQMKSELARKQSMIDSKKSEQDRFEYFMKNGARSGRKHVTNLSEEDARHLATLTRAQRRVWVHKH